MGGVHEILAKASKSLYFTMYIEPPELGKKVPSKGGAAPRKRYPKGRMVFE